jgi:hypothetical protein
MMSKSQSDSKQSDDSKKFLKSVRKVIRCGLQSLPPVQDFAETAADTWEQLGPPPKVLFDKLPPEP